MHRPTLFISTLAARKKLPHPQIYDTMLSELAMRVGSEARKTPAAMAADSLCCLAEIEAPYSETTESAHMYAVMKKPSPWKNSAGNQSQLP